MCPSAYKFFRDCQEVEVLRVVGSPAGYVLALPRDPERIGITIGVSAGYCDVLKFITTTSYVTLARVQPTDLSSTSFIDASKIGSRIQDNLDFAINTAGANVLISVLRSPKDFK